MTHPGDTNAVVENLFKGRIADFPLFDVIDALPAAVYTIDARGRIDIYNQAAIDLWGREPDRDDVYWCGSGRLYHPDGTPMPHDQCPMARALISGMAIKGEEAIAERPDGSRVTFRAYPTPLRNSAGQITGAVNMMLDVTARKAAEREVATRIRQLQTIAELGLLALCGDDLQSLFERAVDQLASALDVELAKILELDPDGGRLFLRAGTGWQDGLVGKTYLDPDKGSQAGYTLSVGEPVIVDDLRTETRFSGPSLLTDHGVVSGLSIIIGGGGGQVPFGVLGAHTKTRRSFSTHDIFLLQSVANILAMSVERRTYKDRQALLVGEMSHRVKNTLSVILAISRQTGQNAETIEDFRTRFEERLVALSKAHNLLHAGDWSGAGLGSLLDLLFRGQADESRFDLDIEDVVLSPSGTQAMTLVVHELMTNAVKYGALSDGSGKVTARGRHETDGEEKIYRLTWAENGGPPVEKPERQGFGSKLIDATVQAQCGGRLSVDWRPEGLVLECVLPLSSITSAAK